MATLTLTPEYLPLRPSRSVPQGVSASSDSITRRGIQSRQRFYEASAALRSYPDPIVLDYSRVFSNLIPTINAIGLLLDRPEGWNGYDVAAPDWHAIERAKIWVATLFAEVLLSERAWIQPQVSSGRNGEILLEWWKGDRNLEVYIEIDRVESLQTLASDPDADIIDADASRGIVRAEIWQWLNND